MIDAYEIGIQLLLQDDVSAGLAVINRGLAEVDRAIAATSASLAGLVQEAERPTKVVAAMKTVQPTTRLEADSVVPLDAGPQERSNKVENVGPSANTSGEANTVDMTTADTPIAPAATSSPNVAPVVHERDQVKDPVEGLTPVLHAGIASDRTARNQPSGDGESESAQPTPSVKREQAGVAALNFPKTEPRPDQWENKKPEHRDVLSPSVLNREAVRRDTRFGVMASISRLPGHAAGSGAQEDGRQDPLSAQRRVTSRAIAPWSGVEQLGVTEESTRVAQRAAAPPQQSQERNEGGGGTVMLDGRLVGQWLSDHMAREASRPPGGTSFFDPRQTPAWNVSGAI